MDWSPKVNARSGNGFENSLNGRSQQIDQIRDRLNEKDQFIREIKFLLEEGYLSHISVQTRIQIFELLEKLPTFQLKTISELLNSQDQDGIQAKLQLIKTRYR